MENIMKGDFINSRFNINRGLTFEEYDFYGVNKIPFPKNAMVELSSVCNHACVFCTNPRMKRASSRLGVDFFQKFMNDATDLGLEEVGLYTTGEPLMMKNLIDFIEIAKASSIKYIYITTNGKLAKIERMKKLIGAGLNSVKFSINAGSKETYKLVHGYDDFDSVINNLKDLRTYVDHQNIKVKILSSFVLTRHSTHEIEDYKNIVGPLVDDFFISDVEGQGGQSLQQEKGLKSDLSPTYPEEGLAKPCKMLWNRLHVTQEGYLTLCCVDYENSLVYADLNKTSLKKAWNNIIISQMRKRHLDQNLKGTLCHNCLYGVENEFEPIMNVKKTNKRGK